MSSLVDAFSGFSKEGGLTSVLGLVSSGIGTIGSITQSSAQAKALEAEGKMAQAKSIWEAEQKRKEQLRTASMQRAKYAKAGVDVTSGSPLEVMADTKAEYEADIEQLLRTGWQQRAMAKKEARNVRTAGWWRTGGSVLKGLTEFTTSPLGKKWGLSLQ